MHVSIVDAIDSEIHKLTTVRNILLATWLGGARDKQVKPHRPKKTVAKPAPVALANAGVPEAPIPATQSPRITLLPPVQRKMYSRRPLPRVVEPTALGAAHTNKPVFVPRIVAEIGVEAAAPAAVVEVSPAAMELAMRQFLFSDAQLSA